MNAAAILALISELYEKIAILTEENRRLQEALAAKNKDEANG